MTTGRRLAVTPWLAGIALSTLSACSAGTTDRGDGVIGAGAGGSGGALPMQAGSGGAGSMAPPPPASGTGGRGGSGSQLPVAGSAGVSGSGSGGSGGTRSAPDACATGDLDTDSDGTADCDDACPADADKTEPGECGCGQPEPAQAGVACGEDEPDEVDPNLCRVQPITPELRDIHGGVYTRYASANGVPVLSTDSPQDEALRRACTLLLDLSQRAEVLETMLDRNIGLVVMGVDETSADFPEFAAWGVPDSRARGLGGVPRGLCAEENVMCDRSVDRWRGESICVHEFAHTMHLGVYNVMDSTFNSRLQTAFRAAIDAGKYANTYAASNATEYFGEGVQDWYNTNLESARPNGVHNEINTRAELEAYDPGLYEILAEVLPDQPRYKDCYYYE
jgi:hypothetical protein